MGSGAPRRPEVYRSRERGRSPRLRSTATNARKHRPGSAGASRHSSSPTCSPPRSARVTAGGSARRSARTLWSDSDSRARGAILDRMLSRPRSRPIIRFIEPCLPRRADKPPAGRDWIHEIKHDGFCIMARREAAGVRLLTRNGHDFAGRFPLAAAAVAALPARSCLIDGEAIVTDRNGLAVFDLIRGHRLARPQSFAPSTCSSSTARICVASRLKPARAP